MGTVWNFDIMPDRLLRRRNLRLIDEMFLNIMAVKFRKDGDDNNSMDACRIDSCKR
jgi:hypothetical protein